MKKIKQNNKNNNVHPDTVDEADNPEDIVNRFKCVYSALYNSTPSVLDSLNNLITMNDNSIGEAMKITGNVVKEAATKLKPGKCDFSGSYSSDAILNAPDNLFSSLAMIFQSFLIHGIVTQSLLSCVFLPLLKPLKDPAKSDSYSAIAASMYLSLYEIL